MNTQVNYKLSFYNFLVKIDESSILLYNSLRNCLLTTDNSDEIKFIYALLSKKRIDISKFNITEDFLTKLINSGVIIKYNDNEKNIIKRRIELIQKNLVDEPRTLFLTICPTNSCNMACPYCFEENKPKNGQMTDVTIKRILDYTEEILKKYNKIEILNITWYGGEPLLAPNIIKMLSNKFIELARKNSLKYRADIITNGSLLNKKNWQLLKDCEINSAQVTLDGSRETHNKSRPLVGVNPSSYDLILNNLALIPKNFKLRIRVNLDSEIALYLDKFLKDLDEYKIWPHNAQNVNISMARREKYKSIPFNGEDKLLSQEEFFRIKSSFLEQRISYYNNWASKSGRKIAKYAFHYPEVSNLTCAEVALPISFVIDSFGNMYKCWGYVNDKNKGIQNISESFAQLENNPLVKKAKKFNKFYYDKECENCRYLPICDVDCMMKHSEESLEKTCCEWKFTLEEKLRKQYVLLKNHPEKIQDLSVFEKQKKDENCNR